MVEVLMRRLLVVALACLLLPSVVQAAPRKITIDIQFDIYRVGSAAQIFWTPGRIPQPLTAELDCAGSPTIGSLHQFELLTDPEPDYFELGPTATWDGLSVLQCQATIIGERHDDDWFILWPLSVTT
jgi:hypothetical protein